MNEKPSIQSEPPGAVVRPEGRTTNDPRPSTPPSPSGPKAGTNEPCATGGSPAGVPRSPISPSSRLAGLSPYSPPAPTHTIDLHLDANEGPGPSQSVLDAIARVTPDAIRRYPDATPLEAKLAEKLSTDPSRVLVTNGGDDAIDRACRAVLEPGRTAILHTPTFEMIPRGVRLASATPVEIPWRTEGFPKQAFLDAIEQCNRETGQPPAMIALVTPNNPTGCVIPLRKILAIADAAPNSLVLVDLAYIEFADEDPTPTLLERDNIMMVRTFSKALGLAGLRVGYALAPGPIITLLRTTGGPYPVSPISLAAASASLDEHDRLAETVARVRTERTELTALLTRHGARPMPTQANFVTADFSNCSSFPRGTGVPPVSPVSPSEALRYALATRGIAVRGWPTRPDLAGLLRITLPANQPDFVRLTAALTQILGGSPQ
jgi:histidinol-phosphate aminotransferase